MCAKTLSHGGKNFFRKGVVAAREAVQFGLPEYLIDAVGT
jgi:hypothetical protein